MKARRGVVHKIKTHLQAITLNCDLISMVEIEHDRREKQLLKHLKVALEFLNDTANPALTDARKFVEQFEKEVADEKEET